MNESRLRRLAAPFTAASLFVLACSHDEELARASLEPPVEPGGVCRTDTAHCLNESSILRCDGRVWTERSCAAVCGATASVALGCYDRAYGDECLCAAPEGDAGGSSSCTERAYCSDADTLVRCGQYGLERRSCADLCAELDPPRSSAGCEPGAASGTRDDCVCTFEGMPCQEEPSAVCDGASHLGRCAGGVWVLEDCAGQCAPGERAFCSTWADDGEAACGCEPAA